MKHKPQIDLIATRIKQLGKPMSRPCKDDALYLRDITVHAIDVDKGGYVWFTILKPIYKCPDQFFVELNFHKNKLSYHLKLSGIAEPVTDPLLIGQLPAVLNSKVLPGRILISVRIAGVEYVEQEQTENLNWYKLIKNKIWDKFQPAISRSFNLKVQNIPQDRLS